MLEHSSLLAWTDPRWLAQVHAWVHTEAERLGLQVNGAIEQPHVRPWSTVLRVPTTAGNLFFKAVEPVLLHEVAVTAALAHGYPDRMVPLLAADVGQGWMLMADGGTRLREIIRSDRDLRHWEMYLPVYVSLQRQLAGRVDDLLALGAPDRRLHTLPAHYDRLLVDTAALAIDQPDGLSTEAYRQLCDLSPRVAALCRELAAYRVPETLHHGDLHDGNIFVVDGHARFFDWGDSSVTHPFFSLRTMFVSVEMSLGLEEGDEPEQLRNAYLEPWTRYEPRAALLDAYLLARQLSPISSALGWHRIISTLDEQSKAQYVEPVPSLLLEFLQLATGPAT